MNATGWDENRWRFLLAACLVTAAFIGVRVVQSGSPDDPGSLDDLDEMYASVSEGSYVRRAAYLALGIAGALGLAQAGRVSFRLQGANGVLACALVAWCGLSVLWSGDPALSFRRMFVFLAVLVAALAAVKHFSWREILLLGLVASGSQLAASFSAAIGEGTFRPWEPEYRFSGLLHPNHEAVNCAVLLVTAFFLAQDGRRARLPLYLVALTALGFLVLTRSRTSLVGATSACALACWSTASRRARLLALFTAVAAACLGFVVVGEWIAENADRVVRLGRSDVDTATLAGRIPLWEELLPYASERPWGGYGFNSFWTPERIEDFADSQGWSISHAHCDYVDMLLGTGLVGLALYIAVLGAGIRSATVRARAVPEAGASALPAWPWFAAIGGVTEGIGLQSYLLQFMLIAALAYVALREWPGPGEGDPQ